MEIWYEQNHWNVTWKHYKQQLTKNYNNQRVFYRIQSCHIEMQNFEEYNLKAIILELTYKWVPSHSPEDIMVVWPKEEETSLYLLQKWLVCSRIDHIINLQNHFHHHCCKKFVVSFLSIYQWGCNALFSAKAIGNMSRASTKTHIMYCSTPRTLSTAASTTMEQEISTEPPPQVMEFVTSQPSRFDALCPTCKRLC
jgi:hypothetical protein